MEDVGLRQGERVQQETADIVRGTAVTFSLPPPFPFLPPLPDLHPRSPPPHQPTQVSLHQAMDREKQGEVISNLLPLVRAGGRTPGAAIFETWSARTSTHARYYPLDVDDVLPHVGM